jgi:hypothetical protein
MQTLSTISILITIAAGGGLLIAGVRFLLSGLRTAPERAEGYARLVYFGRSFRCAITGVSALVAGLGFAVDQRSLAWLFIVIGVQELWESTVLIAILRTAEERALVR